MLMVVRALPSSLQDLSCKAQAAAGTYLTRRFLNRLSSARVSRTSGMRLISSRV